MKQSLSGRHFSIDVSTRAKSEAFRNQSAWACFEKQKGYVRCVHTQVTSEAYGPWELKLEVSVSHRMWVLGFLGPMTEHHAR